jgi:hypothetical protein
MSELLEQALVYAEKMSWHIHPCMKNKRPYLEDWPHQATNDTDTIKQWWKKWPDASIGCKCGPDSGIWVVDVDLPHGPKTLQALQETYGNLPETLKQKTGSGGLQIFFNYNGTEIRNSAGKIGKGVDVRGSGGYIILPPSGHPSGQKYEWMKKARIKDAPDWIKDLAKAPPEPKIDTGFGGNTKYGLSALAKEVITLASTSEADHNRNDTLNLCAYNLGQLVAGGELEEGHVFNSLLGAAIAVGLSEVEARRTIGSGLKAGHAKPRRSDRDDYYFDPTEIEHDKHDKHDSLDETRQDTTKHDKTRQGHDTHDTPCATSPPQNLAAHIREWITNSTGSFTTEQLDREFCLSTRKEKQNRDYVLRACLEKDLIKRDKRVKGKYHILDSKIEWIDLDAAEDASFPLELPFGLHNYVKIPHKAVIILAGSSNAGKTGLMLNTINLNIKQHYEILYLMSEMGRGEYKGRIKSFDNMKAWKSVKAASKSYDFDGAVQHYNQDGLTCIDFLEEVEGEYFKIASNIRDVYDALNDGVAMIAIQKKTDSDYARGGQATMEKARLYLSLDHLATREHSIVCALKIVKVKHWLKRNLQNHELHFEITRGSQIEPLTDWMNSNKVNRKAMIAQYENPDMPESDGEYIYFKVDSGEYKRVTFKDAEKWQTTFESINVVDELERIAQDSLRKPFLKHKSWFFQLSNLLAKKNDGRGSA